MARYPYREIIGLYSTGLSEGKVAHLCGCSIGKAGDVVRRARELGIGWPVPAELSDDDLEQLVDPLPGFRRHPPDFPRIADDLGVRRLGKGNRDAAYAVYLEHAAEADAPPYAESTFAGLFRDWIELPAFSLKMAVNWHAGEEVQADWAGRTLSIWDAEGTSAPAFLFVATLPYSNLTFIRASLDMGSQSWLEHHVAMFAYFGGVPLFTVCDNVLTAVTLGGFNEKSLNRRYADLADHYGTIVIPARANRPDDKADVEGHVRIMANRIVGILAEMRFTSIAQLNSAIAELLEVFNEKLSAALGGMSRREAFESQERDALQPLPDAPYAPATWKRYRVVDGIACVRGNYYQVPSRYDGKKVWARITPSLVELFDPRRKQVVGSYPRREDGAETFEGLPGTCPDRFRPLDDWALANGRDLLLSQWDAERNGGPPSKVVCRSKKKAWWRCPECGFSWREAVVRRTSRGFDDCLACAGIALLPGVNDLATTHPAIASEWDDGKNPMPASAVFADWHQRVWWKGACGHSWLAPVADRTGSAEGALCPVCCGREALAGFNDIGTLCPELAAKWHPSKNRGLEPGSTSVMFAREVYLWDGPLSRIWRETPRSWMLRNGFDDVLAPFDALLAKAREADASSPPTPTHSELLGRAKATVKWHRFNRESDLKLSLDKWCREFGHEYLLDEWDAERNGELTPAKVSRAWNGRVWWKGACGHSWLESVRNRTYDDGGCIYCSRRRVLAGFSSVECLEARLLALWHPTRNEGLDPGSVSDRSHIPVWWQCPECGYEWREPLRRTNPLSRRCPACEGREGYLVPGRNDLAGSMPRLAVMVDPLLNGDVDPASVFTRSKSELWWRGACGHVWLARVDRMAALKDASDACPYCSGRRLLRGFNDLATVAPDVAAEWDLDRNGGLTPEDVRSNSSAPANWHGACGHRWEAQVGRRASGEGCPYCSGRRVLAGENDLETLHPDIAAEWDVGRNGGLLPSHVREFSNREAWWTGACGHTWKARVNNRVRNGSGCPVCANRQVVPGVNDLATTHPALASQWDEARNGVSASQVAANRAASSWWVCPEGHSFHTPVVNRTRDPEHDPGCPYCAGRKAWPGFNDLATTHPQLAAEWHPHMNKGLKPTDVTAGSNKSVWWRREECGHVFEAKVCNRARANHPGCPYCSGRRTPERPINLRPR